MHNLMMWNNEEVSTKRLWRLFKVSMLLTPYDRLLNSTKSDHLKELSIAISNTKCTGNNIVDEEWLNFYTSNEGRYEIHISESQIFILYSSEHSVVEICFFSILRASNIRIQCKDTTVQLKYYMEWEMKLQMSFYTAEEASEFKLFFNDLVRTLFMNCHNFMSLMNKLTKSSEAEYNLVVVKTDKSFKELIEEYFKMIDQ